MQSSGSFYIIYGEPDKTYTSLELAEKYATEIVRDDPGRKVVICECTPLLALKSSIICR